jgi:serine/threonine protein kinase
MKAGTSLFIAPEVLISTKYDHKCDIFSFGIIMFQILTQCEESEIYSKERLGEFNIDYKITSDKNFRPEIPEKYLNDKIYDEFIGFYFLFFIFYFLFFIF